MLRPVVSYDERRFAEIVLYVAKRVEDDPTGGATKLNKILYFADFAHQRAHGRPITGAEYQRLPHGPAPRRLVPVRDRLVSDGDATLRAETYSGYPQDRLVARRDPAPSILDAEEQATLDQVIAALWGRSGAEVSRRSHDEMAWQLVSDHETIPYEYAYIVRPALSPRLRDRLRLVEQAKAGDAG